MAIKASIISSKNINKIQENFILAFMKNNYYLFLCFKNVYDFYVDKEKYELTIDKDNNVSVNAKNIKFLYEYK